MTNSPSDVVERIHIRPAHQTDELPAGLPALRPDEDGPRWRRSLVAVLDDEVVGLAVTAWSPVTDCYFCEITVAEPLRRQGIGTRLYSAIHALTDPRYPVLTRAMRSQPLRRLFAESLGCSVRTHCPEPWVDPPTAEVQRWIAGQRLPEGYTTVAMQDQPVDTVVDAWTTYFVWSHEPFGTVHADQVPQTWEGYSRGLDPAASMLALDRTGAIVAFSLVSPDVWDGRTMIVSETVHRDQPDGLPVLAATVAASLAVLADRGIHRVELEGHTTDAHFPTLAQALPSSGGDPMDILELAAPPR